MPCGASCRINRRGVGQDVSHASDTGEKADKSFVAEIAWVFQCQALFRHSLSQGIGGWGKIINRICAFEFPTPV